MVRLVRVDLEDLQYLEYPKETDIGVMDRVEVMMMKVMVEDVVFISILSLQ